MRISDWSSDVCSSDLVRTVTRPLIETDPRPETGRALMLATLYQGEDSHAPTRRDYFPPPHPPPARRLSRSYRPEHSGCRQLFARPHTTRPGDPFATEVRYRDRNRAVTGKRG